MADITAAMVKDLRERTGSGMMECKKALQETNGDAEAAIELMRIKGQTKAVKKAGRTAAEGKTVIARDGDRMAAIVEINCETDFVARDENFTAFAQSVADVTLKTLCADKTELLGLNLSVGGETVEEARHALVAKIGENIEVRRVHIMKAASGEHIGAYIHGNRIGVLVHLKGGDEALAKDLAMHIAANNPQCIRQTEIAADLIAKEREIYVAQAADSGKPKEIIEKMVQGRLNKFLDEVSLLGQPFVKDPDTKVSALLVKANADVIAFIRFEVGEGVEKKVEDFAAEVAAARGSN
jgi:elongation factor Ts